MKYLLLKIKKHLKTLVQFVLVFGAAFLVLLYFLGYYDLSFLDRYDIFDDEPPKISEGTKNDSPFPSVDMSDIDSDNESESSETSATNTESIDTSPKPTESAPTNVSKVYTADDLADSLISIPTISQSLENGAAIAPTDGTYIYDSADSDSESESALAKLTFDFKLPTRYAFSKRNVEVEEVITPGENGEDTSSLISDERYVVISETDEADPAVELYMGYILLDDGEDSYILSSDGTPLCRYNANRYTPAYTRDRNDRPLFRREDDGVVRYFYLSVSPSGENYPVIKETDAETGETGNITEETSNETSVTSFVLSDYDPETDSRGLYFDYPASFGKSDSTAVYVIHEDVVVKAGAESEEDPEYIFSDALPVGAIIEDGELALSVDEESASELTTAQLNALAELANAQVKKLFGYEVRDAQGQVTGPLTAIKFVTAFPFMQNRAAVTTNDDRGSIYFINENGYRAFSNAETYLNEYNRYVTEYLFPPLTHGMESLGSYYYDSGLVMVRRQIIDYWNYEQRGLTRVVKEYNCLLRLDGSEYLLPAGYNLESYSEGMLILSKNGKYGIFDAAGEWIAQPIYSSATPFIGGLSVLTLPDGRCGMIDLQGDIVLPFTYDSISTLSSGLIATYRSENGWAVYRVMDTAAGE